MRLPGWRRRRNEDLDKEIQAHLAMAIHDRVARGARPDEADAAARRELGNLGLIKESTRRAWGWTRLEQLGRDVRYALRTLRRSPVFALTVVLSLASGIGANTAVFNLVYNVLLAPLALPHPEQLVVLTRVGGNGADDEFSWEEFRAMRETGGVGALAASWEADNTPIATAASREFGLQYADGAFFATIGLRPLEGRLITPDDDARQAAVVVLSQRLAERLFPDGSTAVGRTVAIRGSPFTVIGVAPASYRGLDYPGSFRAAIPLGAAPLIGTPDERRNERRWFRVVGRLTVDAVAARASLAATLERCCAAAPSAARERLDVIDIRRGIPGGKNDVRADVRTTLVMLLLGMGLVLVVVCCNTASLLLVRASARQREIAVRLALGASRRRLVGQLVTESIPLAVCGGAGGLALAAWGTSAFVRTLPSGWSDYVEIVSFQPGLAVFAFTGAITIGCVLAFAAYPALRATGPLLGRALRLDARASRTAAQGAIARAVVVTQIAVTLVLVTAASLLAATLRNLGRIDAGFAIDSILLASVETRGTSYEPAGIVPLHAEILRRVRGLPGARVAGMATLVPMYGGRNASRLIEVPGYTAPRDAQPSVRLVAVTPGYFAASGIRLLTGRDFTSADGARAQPVAIVSAALARRYFGDRDPIGVTIGLRGDALERVRIVGVAADARYLDLRAPPSPMVYAPVPQSGAWPFLQLVIRTEGTPARMTRSVMRAVEAAAPGIRVRRVSDMGAERAATTALERLAAQLAGFVSVMALVLSAVGLYGVVAYGVARRTSEIGIRLALGASPPAIIRLVARETVVLAGAGVLVGGPLSFAASGAMASQLFGVGAHDPAVTAAAILLLATVALVASVVPACRAVRVDPRIAMNAD